MKCEEKETNNPFQDYTNRKEFYSPMFELHYLVEFMKQELVKLANLNNEYESFLKEIKNE